MVLQELEIRVRPSDRNLVRLATIGVLIAALGLAACGRKGPLEPPPAALVPPSGPAVADQGPGQPTAVEAAPTSGGPQAPITGHRPKYSSFFLDWLLY
jgi:predicted small lipoprotein YifL